MRRYVGWLPGKGLGCWMFGFGFKNLRPNSQSYGAYGCALQSTPVTAEAATTPITSTTPWTATTRATPAKESPP